MRWLQSEYILKGTFLGLWMFLALQAPDWAGIGRVALYMAGGLAAALAIGTLDQLRRGQKFGGGPVAFVLFLLLEYPMLVYAGLIFALAGGTIAERNPARPEELLGYCAIGGALFGLLLTQLLSVGAGELHKKGTLLIAAGGLGATLYFLNEVDFFDLDRWTLGLQLLVGLPFFYLLVFSGVAEESEAEIAALCVGVGVSAWLMRDPDRFPAVSFIIPIALYYLYSTWVLPGLRVFKHVLRGQSYLSMRRTKMALMSFRRAIELDAKSQLAKSGMWQLHLGLDLAKVQDDPEVLAMLDLQMCLNRAGELLQGTPNAAQLDEARRLLDLVENQRPKLLPEVTFQRAVAATHAKELGVAAELLTELLDPEKWEPRDASRRRVLVRAWLLAAEWHPALKRLVGDIQLSLPGRKMEAIAAIERFTAGKPPEEVPDDVRHLRSEIYAQLGEEEYLATGGPKLPEEFNHDYVEQLGLSLIENRELWTRGASYLRMAARGLTPRAPHIFRVIAMAYERAGDLPAVRSYLEQVVRAGLSLGVGGMDAAQKKAYFESIERLAVEAEKAGDLDAAIANRNLLTQSDQCGIETFRKLADLYERKGDSLAALRLTETGLTYNSKDVDLLARKDKYYNSIEPDQLKPKAEEVRPFFDAAYCKRKARALLEYKNAEQDVLEWAERLARLAQVMFPKELATMALVAKCNLRFGERDPALVLLEDIREAKPSGVEEEDAWFWACQTLGKMYLDELARPDLAIGALTDFKRSNKSGADTVYHLGRAYEATGNFVKAQQCYEQVTAYEGHPLAGQAYDALYRVKQGTK